MRRREQHLADRISEVVLAFGLFGGLRFDVDAVRVQRLPGQHARREVQKLVGQHHWAGVAVERLMDDPITHQESYVANVCRLTWPTRLKKRSPIFSESRAAAADHWSSNAASRGLSGSRSAPGASAAGAPPRAPRAWGPRQTPPRPAAGNRAAR